MMEITNEQNHQRMHLEQWAQDLREREMHVVERELKLLMANKPPRERTPKIQKRSGNFMRQLFSATLNGSSSLSSTTATQVISHPTSSFFFLTKNKIIIRIRLDFQHLISVSRENNTLQQHHHPSLDNGSSSTLPTTMRSPPLPKSTATSSTLPANSKLRSPSPVSPSTTQSTPSTPNLNRLRTLTCTYHSKVLFFFSSNIVKQLTDI